MGSRYDPNPFEEEELNPFANQGSGSPQSSYGGGAFYMPAHGSVPPATSKLSPLPPEPAGYDRGATINIPLENPQDFRTKEKELKAKEAELKRREQVHVLNPS